MYSISFQEDSLLPRERLAKEGVEALSNQELLAILLRTGTRQASVFEIAQESFEQPFKSNGFEKNDPAGIVRVYLVSAVLRP